MRNIKNFLGGTKPRQILASGLLAFFVLFQLFQFHHQHQFEKTAAEHGIQLNKFAPDCHICDFVAKKQNSLLSSVALDIEFKLFLPTTAHHDSYQDGTPTDFDIQSDNKDPPFIA